jgi:hypothetical protein
MPMSEYHSNNADVYERQCGVIWDDYNEEWAYTLENDNYKEDEDEDDE